MTLGTGMGKTPRDLLVNMQVKRLGNITFVLQFISLAIMFLGMISFGLALMYFVVLFLYALCTFFLVFFDPEFVALFSAVDGVLNFSLVIASWWKFTAPITIFLSVLSIICLELDKSKKHTAKIVLSAIVASIALIYLGSFIIAMLGASR